jgi:predicted AAA+ superfamily ATPase
MDGPRLPEPTNPMPLLERHLAGPIREALQDTPAILVNGPRQSGKTTLVQQLAGAMRYFTLDNPNTLATAQADPVGFVETLDRAIIDEIQRAPQLMLALKQSIDQDRRPGRFLLTGSANVLALPQIADSLAGRMETHTLLPLSQAEIQGRPNDFLHRAQAQNWPLAHARGGLQERVLMGGYPEMRERTSLARRQSWAKAYVTHIMERDVQDIARIDQLVQLPPLLNLLATQCGQLINLAQLGGQLGLDVKTANRYVGVLERLYLVQRLPAWSRHEANRLVKTPKLHFLDGGLQATLTRLTPDLLLTQRTRWGATLETWVHAELRKAIALSPEPWYLSHYRDKDQVEVDFVLEDSLRQVIGVEVKAAATVQPQDFKGLKRLQALAGDSFISGIVLYDGEHALPFGDRLWAVPLSAL